MVLGLCFLEKWGALDHPSMTFSIFPYTFSVRPGSALLILVCFEWGELLGDQAISTANLDSILHQVEIIHLNEDSYRMKHRSTIFGQ